MDPQQRLFLECAAEALEVGGRPCAPATPAAGSAAAVGVFAAVETSDYAALHQRAVDAADLLAELPVKRAEDLVTDGARLSAHFAQMFDTASRAAAGAEPGDVRGSE